MVIAQGGVSAAVPIIATELSRKRPLGAFVFFCIVYRAYVHLIPNEGVRRRKQASNPNHTRANRLPASFKRHAVGAMPTLRDPTGSYRLFVLRPAYQAPGSSMLQIRNKSAHVLAVATKRIGTRDSLARRRRSSLLSHESMLMVSIGRHNATQARINKPSAGTSPSGPPMGPAGKSGTPRRHPVMGFHRSIVAFVG